MAGSTFKPVSLAAAITDGYSLKSTFEGNSPYTFPDGLKVHNEGAGAGTNYGSAVISVTAMEESINTAFVDMSASMKDGPQKILDDGATRWGSRRRARTRTIRASPTPRATSTRTR